MIKLGVPKDIAVTLEEIAKERITIPLVKVKGILELQCTKPNGVVLIRETLLKAQKIGESQGTKARIYVVAPPKYRVEVSAEDYKSAENALGKVTKAALKNVAKIGGKGAFKREK